MTLPIAERHAGLTLLQSGTAALLLAACALPAAAGEKLRYQPFKAAAAISEVLGLPSMDCYGDAPSGGSAASGTISGQGIAASVGAFTLNSLDCITSASPPPYLLPPLNFSSKQLVIKAGNGDQIVAEYEGTATALPNGLLVLNGTYTFISGTGRFLGVKGSGVLEGIEDISTQPAKGFVTLSGRISR